MYVSSILKLCNVTTYISYNIIIIASLSSNISDINVQAPHLSLNFHANRDNNHDLYNTRFVVTSSYIGHSTGHAWGLTQEWAPALDTTV